MRTKRWAANGLGRPQIFCDGPWAEVGSRSFTTACTTHPIVYVYIDRR